jgi:hypothetical protein
MLAPAAENVAALANADCTPVGGGVDGIARAVSNRAQ